MALLLWDASALVKRYFLELGSETVDALFPAVSLQEMATTPWGYAETYAEGLITLNPETLAPADVAAFLAGLPPS